MNRAFVEIPIGDIVGKGRIRKDLGDLTTLENSIRKLGLVYPVILDRNNVLVCGERRLAACRNIGLTAIPAMKLDIDHTSMTALDIRSDVNLCRMPLSQEELVALIAKKKSTMAGEPAASAGFLGKLRRIFSS